MKDHRKEIEILAKIFENQQKKGDPRYMPHKISAKERELIKIKIRSNQP